MNYGPKRRYMDEIFGRSRSVNRPAWRGSGQPSSPSKLKKTAATSKSSLLAAVSPLPKSNKLKQGKDSPTKKQDKGKVLSNQQLERALRMANFKEEKAHIKDE